MKKEKYEYKGHGPWLTLGGKQWCFNCGLVALNNKITRFCIDKGCLYDLHSSYKSQLKKAGGMKR